jgi:flagellar hook-basal body complex protein FliE
MTVPSLAVTPSGAAGAYARVQSGNLAGLGAASGSGTAGAGFGDALSRAMQGVVDSGHQADAQSMQAIAGGGNLTEVVTAVSRAELALQSAVAIRDRVVQAYQDVMRMPI